jgi:hypothetical protein
MDFCALGHFDEFGYAPWATANLVMHYGLLQ